MSSGEGTSEVITYILRRKAPELLKTRITSTGQISDEVVRNA